MSKAVLALLFAVFALTTGLPVRNRFYEDVDDYRREFIPKDEAADFDESVYDEYLRRRQPIDLNEGLYCDHFVRLQTLYFIIYMRLFTLCLQHC